MAHLRLFQPKRGTQSLCFPDHGVPVMRRRAAPPAQTPAVANGKCPCSAQSAHGNECLTAARLGPEADRQKPPYSSGSLFATEGPDGEKIGSSRSRTELPLSAENSHRLARRVAMPISPQRLTLGG